MNDIDEQCGCEIGCGFNRKRFSFRILNYFATSKFALLFLCIASIGQGFLTSGLLSVVISTLEKRFHLHSTETGFIASCYDIASLFCVLLITYIGGRGHKTLWIGWGVFILGIGSLVFALPHFIAPTYTPGDEQHNTCKSSVFHDKCFPSNLKGYIFFFIFGQLLHGAGGTTLYTLGVTYLDENVAQVQSSSYHGVYYACSVLGPAFGFLAGGRLLTIYTNVYFLDVDISDKSSLWVGAWWLGFVVGGVLTIISSFPIMLLPKRLPGTAHLRIGRETEVHHQQSTSNFDKSVSSNPRLKDIWKSIFVLLRNPTFILLTFAGALDSGLVLGLTTFGPKYLESMYSITPTQSAMYFGILAILAGASGQFLGGYIVTKAKLTVKGILKFCIICSIFTTCTTFIFFSTCPNLPFAGSTVPYSDENKLLSDSFVSSCNKGCNCNRDSYDPVCGDDDVTYYSPCYAGCKSINSFTDVQIYKACSCIVSINSTAKSGKCSSRTCKSLSLFLGVFFFSILGTFLPSTPAIQAILRVVPFSQRSLAIGVKFVILRLIGSIPGPILFGKVLDLACAVWSTECGSNGSCQLYKNDLLAAHMAAFVAVIKVIVGLLFISAWFVYNPPSYNILENSEVTLAAAITGNNVNLPSVREALVGYSHLVRQNSDSNGIRYSALKDEVDLNM